MDAKRAEVRGSFLFCMKLPVYFLSHGAPTMALGLQPEKTIVFFKRLGLSILSLKQEIKALVIISAHWESTDEDCGVRGKFSNFHPFFANISLIVTAAQTPEQIYDFYGFPSELYTIKYHMRGEPQIADRLAQTLKNQGIPCTLDNRRGLDHGSWVLLQNMFPQSELPCIQLSLHTSLDPSFHVRLGQALKSLRDQGCLIIGSGGAVHNLGQVDFDEPGDKAEHWAQTFDEVLRNAACVKPKTAEALCQIALDEPALFQRAHPRTEHFLPMVVAAGALEDDEHFKRIHNEMQYGTLSLAAFESSTLE
jgi:4,5-DOPA dioxygenase extradiol